MDATLNRLYTALRPQLTVKARADLLTQQRAWLVQRDRSCATGDPSCLRRMYGNRIDQLEALTVAAEVGDGKLASVAAVVVKGKWKATAIQDPTGSKHTDGASLAEYLANAELPAIGALVEMTPGKFCLPAKDCGPITWTWKTLAGLTTGEAVARVFGLHQDSPVLEGDNGANQSPGYQLLPRADGTLSAVFILCSSNHTGCRMAAEVWTPASPDAAVSPHP